MKKQNRPICDRCGRRVLPHNDAGLLMAFAADGDLVLSTYTLKTSRHLHAHSDDPRTLFGVIPLKGTRYPCLGSPSAAQYFGGTLDMRERFRYNREMESDMRDAYRQLLQVVWEREGDPQIKAECLSWLRFLYEKRVPELRA